MIKKILWILLAFFLIFWILHSPSTAGHSVHGALKNVWDGLKAAGTSLTKFFNQVF